MKDLFHFILLLIFSVLFAYSTTAEDTYPRKIIITALLETRNQTIPTAKKINAMIDKFLSELEGEQL